jgi:oxygen-independent coproporphyrinogen-3 oxidase
MTPLEIYSAHVPRYTSYPTAPHFHRGIGAAQYAAWLTELTPETPLSLYLHVPFCDTLCWFCACHTTVINHYGPVKDYVTWLQREIALAADQLDGRHPVSHIHFGGGSPTMLKPEELSGLRQSLRGAFDIAKSAEIAIEIDPRGFGTEQADMLAEFGINRASIGIQDCDPKVQRAINRLQSPEETRHAVQLLRERGVERINLDLVYGLPHQTLAGLEKNLELAVELKPSRLALFGYAHVPFFKKHQALIPEAALPGIETRLAMAAFAENWLAAHGYQAIGLDHFARPEDELAVAQRLGVMHRNFQGYTVDSAPALLGLGASAISALPQGYVQNHAAVTDYRAALSAGRLPVTKGIALTGEDRLRRDVIEQIMCYLTVDLGVTAESHGYEADALDWALSLLEPLVNCGAVTIDGRGIMVSSSQRAAARIAGSLFDAYLSTSAAKHSVSA